MKAHYGVDSMPETARERRRGVRGLARRPGRLRAAQPAARRAPRRRTAGCARRSFRSTIRAAARGSRSWSTRDEHPRETTLEALAKLRPPFRDGGTVTAGNASGVNDGACALLIASERAAKRYGLTPRARVVGAATAGVAPRIMGIGPAPATRKLLERTGLSLAQMDVIELNEAFASQALAVLRELGIADDARAREPQRRRHRARPPARHERCAARDRPRPTSCRAPAGATRCAPCASASARASRW